MRVSLLFLVAVVLFVLGLFIGHHNLFLFGGLAAFAAGFLVQ